VLVIFGLCSKVKFMSMRKYRWKRATHNDKRKRNAKKWRRHHAAVLGAPAAPAAVGDENAD